MANRAARFLVRGRVQGVGYRWFVSRQAERLGLRGFARNLADGTVEVVADGPEVALAQLEVALRRGPTLARVAGVEKSDVPHDVQIPNSFDSW
jgi:acylphosphatase